MRVVIDTNVFISGSFWKGNEEKIIELCIKGNLTNHSSPRIVEEIDRVLQYGKFKLTEDEIERLIHVFLSFSTIMIPQIKVLVVKKDPSDNKFIECALDSDSDFLITGDVHLLELNEFEGIRIVNAGDLLDIMGY